jgi:hypothetical protein
MRMKWRRTSSVCVYALSVCMSVSPSLSVAVSLFVFVPVSVSRNELYACGKRLERGRIH